jgi:DNA-binding GntR family transcriptional regulator
MFKLQRSQSLGAKVKDELVSMIVTRKLKPGDRLKEVEIAEQMDVSRLPVREALLLLEQEGFIESGPYKNNIVVDLNYQEIVNVFLPIRQTIETYALRKFMQIVDDEDVAYLERQIREMEFAKNENRFDRFADADLKFHECILEVSGLRSLLKIWASITNRLRMYFFTSTEILQGRLDDVIDDHKELLGFIKDRNLEDAERKLIEHINEVVIEEPQKP